MDAMQQGRKGAVNPQLARRNLSLGSSQFPVCSDVLSRRISQICRKHFVHAFKSLLEYKIVTAGYCCESTDTVTKCFEEIYHDELTPNGVK